MNQTLVIGSAVVDVIVRVEHLPKCGRGCPRQQTEPFSGGLRLSGQRYSAAFPVPLTAFVRQWAAACTGISSMNS